MIRRVLGPALVVLAAASIYMSWGALFEFALATGMPAERAIVFPVVIDVVTVVAMLLAIMVESPSRSVAAYPWIALVIFGAATIAGNALHVITIPAASIHVPIAVAAVTSALPSVALLLTTHLAAVTVYRRTPAAVSGGETVAEQLAERTVAAPSDGKTEISESDDRTPRERVLELHSSGKSFRDIEAATGVSRSTASRWVKTPAPTT